MGILRVTEIYKSVQGESSWAGRPCTFVRLTGCPLRCRWCDTAYAFKGGSDLSLEDILAQVKALGVPLVELTGGEPLAQKASCELVDLLLAEGFEVLIETSGSESLRGVPRKAHLIMDIKCPGSGMHEKMDWNNLSYLKQQDEIKFVVADRADFDWALACIQDQNLYDVCSILFSPAWGLVSPKDLVAWMLESGVKSRLNLQLHKYIWGPKTKGV